MRTWCVCRQSSGGVVYCPELEGIEEGNELGWYGVLLKNRGEGEKEGLRRGGYKRRRE